MEKVKLVKITHLNNNKDGQPLVSAKTGKPYTRCLIDLADGRRGVSGFGNKTTQSWKEGDEVSIVITQNGQYWNFEVPRMENLLEDRIARLEAAVFGEAKTGMVPAATVVEPDLDNF